MENKRSNDHVIKRLEEIDAVLIAECLAGSRAYGLEHENSDYDYRGVYIQNTDRILKDDIVSQISFSENDEVYYEIGRFIDLAANGNPNIIELLYLMKDQLKDYIPDPEVFLTKKMNKSFGGMAISQIKKATGLNKKINNPQPEKRKSVLDFCYILKDQKAFNLKKLFSEFDLSDCGLGKCEVGKGLYTLYQDTKGEYDELRGILSKCKNSLKVSSVPKSVNKDIHVLSHVFYFNEDGYKIHCKEHYQYWEWVKLRNEERHKSNIIDPSKKYDGKNLMHCLRILYTAKDIAENNIVNITDRPEKIFLKGIRNNEYSYDSIKRRADELLLEVDSAFSKNKKLKDRVDPEFIKNLKLEIRKRNDNSR